MDAVLEFWVITGTSTKEKAVTLDLNDIYGQFHIDIEAMNITIAATKASIVCPFLRTPLETSPMLSPKLSLLLGKCLLKHSHQLMQP